MNLKKCCKNNLPELLAPCGSMEALDAAINAGADAVYFGGATFNARRNAKNFDDLTIVNAIKKCHSYGVKTNITLNTLVYDKEIYEVLKYAELLYKSEADALIIADLGVAEQIHKYFPDFELHASTQTSGHNIQAAKFLQKIGFTRMVCARELSASDIKSLVNGAKPIEIEMFIHGAICVSHSGQCLMSSIIGGRSGNRGECAQPCRLPYDNTYPLSIKDMCLGNHITEIIDSGISSLKIEGRMKSAEYVYSVTSMYRKLLDEYRNLDKVEYNNLLSVFSRNGFTDGYFIKCMDKNMLGIRTDSDKLESKKFETNVVQVQKKIPIQIQSEFFKDKPTMLKLEFGGIEAIVYGEIPQLAKTSPLTLESITKNLTKFGGTPYEVDMSKVDIAFDEGLMLPISQINSLRRKALEMLNQPIYPERNNELPKNLAYKNLNIKTTNIKTARFLFPENIPNNQDFRNYFDIIYLPIEKYKNRNSTGIIIPPVIFDSEVYDLEVMLEQAQSDGIKHALVGNVGHIDLAKKYNFICHGDFRLNAYNTATCDVLKSYGVEDIILSPELTLPQIRDVYANKSVIIYGRLPLMLLEKCVIRDLQSCEYCKNNKFVEITDRKGIKFPLVREWNHRNVLLNSVPTYMADISHGISNTHFIFTTESPNMCIDILNAYKTKKKSSDNIRRLNK